MAWEWVAPVASAAGGTVGAVTTWLAARGGRKHAESIAQLNNSHSARLAQESRRQSRIENAYLDLLPLNALRRIPTVLGISAALLLVSSVAYAAIPSTNGAFNGCVSERTGVLRVIDPSKGQACITRPAVARETPIRWNQTGPAGPVGPAGPGGAAWTGPARLSNLDQLVGLPCDVKSAEPGVVKIHYFAEGPVTFICQKANTPPFPQTTSTVATATPATTTDTSTPTRVTSTTSSTTKPPTTQTPPMTPDPSAE